MQIAARARSALVLGVSVGEGVRRTTSPPQAEKHFLTRYTVKNWISNLYTLLKSALKMQEMPFQRPKFQKISEGACPRTPRKLCRHYGLPLTKILATPLPSGKYLTLRGNSIFHLWNWGDVIYPSLFFLFRVRVSIRHLLIKFVDNVTSISAMETSANRANTFYAYPKPALLLSSDKEPSALAVTNADFRTEQIRHKRWWKKNLILSTYYIWQSQARLR